ncbi:MAG: DNA polymerase III subunit delta' [Roseiflexaceae bacterium]|nr:DNA polymerase III subunit delta' [Roseiflexaceae bacterium]
MIENWGIIGHRWAVDFLRTSLIGGRASHAYLISGPAQLGKALLALRLAQALNCDSSELSGDPCGECRSCRQIARGIQPDVRVAGMASQAIGVKPEDAAKQRDLKIDTVRDWLADVNLKPYESRRRVFILHDAERLNEAAANAMLKTLEEPPPYATLVLVANTSGELMATIVSRCQPLKLRPVPRAEIATALRTHKQLAAEDADLLAAWSGGRPGWAFQMVETPDVLAAQQEQLEQLIGLANVPRGEAFRWAEEQAKAYRSGEQAKVFAALALWQSWWRDVMLTAGGVPGQITHIDMRNDLAKLARSYRIAEVRDFIAKLDATAQQLRENVNPQLALENALLHLPQIETARR